MPKTKQQYTLIEGGTLILTSTLDDIIAHAEDSGIELDAPGVFVISGSPIKLERQWNVAGSAKARTKQSTTGSTTKADGTPRKKPGRKPKAIAEVNGANGVSEVQA